MEDVSLIDLPPEGFEYLNSSWTANSNIHGNIKDIVVTEPTYASPGNCSIGSRELGEIIVDV